MPERVIDREERKKNTEGSNINIILYQNPLNLKDWTPSPTPLPKEI